MKIYVAKLDDDDSIEIFPNAIKDIDPDNIVLVVRCKDCKHRPVEDPSGNPRVFPPKIDGDEDLTCPCLDTDNRRSWLPLDNWYCAWGERRKNDETD